MKKLYLNMLIMFLLILTACSKNVNQEVGDNVVKIWWYEEEPAQDGDTFYNHIMKIAIEKLKFDADLNDIKIELISFHIKI